MFWNITEKEKMLENSTVHQLVTAIGGNQNFTNSRLDNVTTYVIQDVNHWTYILYTLMVFVAFLSTFMNALVLKALSSTGADSIQSNFLIQGVIVSDILLSLALGMQVLPWILVRFGSDPVLSIVCHGAFSSVVKYVLVHIQLYVGLAIAIDRLVSVLRPLHYHTNKYSKTQKNIILGALWFGIPILHVIFNVTDLRQLHATSARNICFSLTEMSSMFYSYAAPSLVVLGLFATIILYIVILGVIIIQRLRRHHLSNTAQINHQGNASLALTFLFVYLVYILCYMPGIIQSTIFMQDLKVDGLPGYNLSAYALTQLIYQLNTIIDPIIFTLRIRSVRNYMRSLCRVGMSIDSAAISGIYTTGTGQTNQGTSHQM